MNNLAVIFLTGLTTGGLTCLALQGGLLATAIAAQRGNEDTSIKGTLLPTAFFLIAKIAAYTLVGALLGLFGSLFQLSIGAQIFIQAAVGIFMVLTALRMLDVHPLLRYFVLTPPKAVFKFMRGSAKSGSLFSPIVLGFLTVFLPCGTTQAMELQAISSGSALQGALVMLAFTAGTAPLFFVLGTLATKFSQAMQTYIYPAAAVMLLILGVMGFDNALTLSGSSWTLKEFWTTATTVRTPATNGQVAGVVAQNNGDKQTINMTVYATGYEPRIITAKAGVPLTLNLTTNKTEGCARAITFPTLKIQKILPETGITTIELPALAKGEIPFSCSMGMYSGKIIAS